MIANHMNGSTCGLGACAWPTVVAVVFGLCILGYVVIRDLRREWLKWNS